MTTQAERNAPIAHEILTILGIEPWKYIPIENGVAIWFKGRADKANRLSVIANGPDNYEATLYQFRGFRGSVIKCQAHLSAEALKEFAR